MEFWVVSAYTAKFWVHLSLNWSSYWIPKLYQFFWNTLFCSNNNNNNNNNNHLLYMSNSSPRIKKDGNPSTGSKNLQSGYKDGIWHRKMYHANNENQKTSTGRKNRTTKSRKNQNARRKGNLQVLGNIRNGHSQTCGDEKKIKKEYHRRTRKLFEIKLYSRNLIKGINTLAVPYVRYSGLFLLCTREELQ